MTERPKLTREASTEVPLDVPDPPAWKVIPTGCTLLDLGLNGGWVVGRPINIIGDTSTGKTLLAIEAMANFALHFSVKDGRYNETENAFLRGYAETVGLPSGLKFVGDDAEKESDRHGSVTVEDFEADFDAFIRPRIGKGKPCAYILDSFDALEAKSEMKRPFGDRQPGVKAALSSEFYRTHIAEISEAECTLIIVSQVRDAIGVLFGPKQVRAGGRAHDFYCSQIVWLSTGKKIIGKVAGVDRTVGVHTTFNVSKNKLGAPFAKASIVIRYNYGVDDEMSNLEWLQENNLGAVGRLTVPIKEYAAALADVRAARDMDTIRAMSAELQHAVQLRWAEIAEASAPTIRKYGDL